MPDIIGQILQRLVALEAAVNGRASEHFDRKLFKAEVALREGVVARYSGWTPAPEKRPGPFPGLIGWQPSVIDPRHGLKRCRYKCFAGTRWASA
jgi:hypothetical protein